MYPKIPSMLSQKRPNENIINGCGIITVIAAAIFCFKHIKTKATIITTAPTQIVIKSFAIYEKSTNPALILSVVLSIKNAVQ